MQDGQAKPFGSETSPWLLGALMFSPITRERKGHQAYANTKSQQDWQCPPSTESPGTSVCTPKQFLWPYKGDALIRLLLFK